MNNRINLFGIFMKPVGTDLVLNKQKNENEACETDR